MKIIFRSKVDLWMVLIALTGSASPLIILIFAWHQLPLGGIIAVLTVFVFNTSLILWVYGNTKYVFDNDLLLIICGPIRKKIQVKDIQNVKPTRNAISSPALSLDRLEITYNNGNQVLISPQNKAEFLAQLEKGKNNPV
jgi:hypothetical protein